MITLGDRTVVAVDVDDTLVIFLHNTHTYRPHTAHVEALKRHYIRGHWVIVWSKGRGVWAERIVKELGLEGFVNQVMSKPDWCIDDKSPETWMERYYLEDTNVRPITSQIKANLSVYTGPTGGPVSLPVPGKPGQEGPTNPTGPRVS